MQMAVLFSAQTLFSGLLSVGMAAAGMAISLLTRQQIMQPIQDLKVSVSAYGRAIARTYGSWRCTGNMFWATDLRLVRVFEGPKGKQQTGGKGKKKYAKGEAQEINTYFADFAMGLCVGPKADVLRIWCDSNLIYDKYNPIGYYNADGVWVPVVENGFSLRPPVTGPGVTNQTKSDEKGIKKAPALTPFTFIFYSGDESQQPDPTMSAASGAAYTPAYRGLCYLIFPNPVALRDFGNRIPTVTAEVTPALNPLPSVSKWTEMVCPAVRRLRAEQLDLHRFQSRPPVAIRHRGQRPECRAILHSGMGYPATD